ncbi:cobalamin biosynthesis protein [Saccharothrix texasensis]|uniref:Cobalt-precorrin 5A hydrolase/precorrin-3B C17-methyltransferase n=1 Tax=Saccharothrix texasensis TaxID=103734 RepID=A0A3N1HE61_9PSEU|nr:cobalamin biosynthesis protein [Saccharothrix texasensis]ROP40776.1 cobalt-precorrin 5A hydrolase/precorrin-3B C17-methyltransferase [Saccharothrix texasensis]
MIGVFAAGERGRRAAVELAGFLGPDAVVPDGPVGPALRALWPRLGSAVFFLGTEATVRLVAPLLRDERADPGVVCVDGGFAVSLLGGADAVAERVADVLGVQAVTTSASAGSPLDELVELLDATVEGDLAACGEAVRLGEPVLLANPLGFPLPALPDNVVVARGERASHGGAEWSVLVDDRVPKGPAEDHVVRVVPRTLVVGVGSGTGVSAAAVSAALAQIEERRGLDLRAIRAFATLDRKVAEQGIADALEDWGFWHDSTTVPLLSYPGEELAVIPVPNPAELAIGIPSVAEAAALRGAMELSGGGRVEIAAEKVKGAGVTVAAARVLPRGRLALVGLGPGDADERTPRAEAELRRASVVVGSAECVAQVRHLLRPGTRVVADGAVRLAEDGAAVAFVEAGAGPEVAGPIRADVIRVTGVTRQL